MYKGWDVHSYTSDFRQVIQSLEIPAKVDPAANATLIGELKAKYAGKSKALEAIAKMNLRYNADRQGYVDPALSGVNVSGILQKTWETVKGEEDESVFAGFGGILADIGGTCIQGDSHRLLSYWIALRRDREQNA